MKQHTLGLHVRHSCHKSMVLVVLVGCAAVILAWLTLVKVSVLTAQIQFGGANAGNLSGSIVLPPPPRELRRALEEAEKALQEQQYSEAVELLNQILDQSASEDYFLPSVDGREVTSLKQRALHILGSMPKSGRETYELESGSEARQLLEIAIELGDVEKITEVSRRFFHTTVGYQSTMLLARYELDSGRPLAAALHLERLHKAAGARRLFGDELSLQLAICWKMAGFDDVALRVLKEEQGGGRTLAGSVVTIAGQQETLPQEVNELGEWLERAIGTGVTFPLAQRNDWALFRGGPDRNATTTGGMPLNKLEWALDAMLNPSDEAIVMQTYESLVSNEIPAIPVMQPLAVNNLLLMRTARLMFGVDMETGRRIWPYPEEYLDVESVPADKPVRVSAGRQLIDKATRLKQRFWQDAIYAQMSSDGERLFLLRDVEPAYNVSQRQFAINRMNGVPAELDFNRLIALELGSQGKTIWTIGGDDSSESRLQDVYFLGVPLPLDGHLYSIAEVKDELKLIVLDAKTGKLEWIQQLAQIEAPLALMPGNVRRLAGASPSFAEGILVCPTSSGAVIAVDIASRSLRWGYKYAVSHRSDPRRTRRVGFNAYPITPIPSPGDHWADSVAIIKDGCVVLTPLESDRLLCLDLLSGKSKWRSRPRKQGLYVGAVHEGIVLLLEQHKIVGLELQTGKPAWPPIELEEEEYPTGRGFLNGGSYFFPTSNSEILKVDVRSGKISERQTTDRVLGNLVCHGDYLVSQNADGVFAYPLRARRRAAVAEQMKLTPNDPDVLDDFASLLVSDGKHGEAMEVLRRSIQFQIDEERKTASSNMLVRIMIDALRRDFSANQGLVDEAMRLANDTKARLNLARVIAVGLTENQESEAAFSAYLDLVDATIEYRSKAPISNKNQLRRGKGDWRKNESIELAAHVQKLLTEPDREPGDSMTEELFDRLESVHSEASVVRLRGWLEVASQMLASQKLQGTADAGSTRLGASLQDFVRRLRLRLATQLIGEEQALEAILLLDRLISESPTTGGPQVIEARAVRALCLSDHGHLRLASAAFDRLAQEFPDKTLLLGRSAIDLRDEFRERHEGRDPSDEPARFGAESHHAWPTGKIKAAPAAFSAPPTTPQWYPVRLLSATEDWPSGSRIVLDNKNKQILILDAYNRVTKQVTIESSNRAAYRATQARVFGQLLVVSFGTNVVGIDLLTDSEEDQVLWNLHLGDADGLIAVDPFVRPKSVRVQSRNIFFSTPQISFEGPDRKQVGQIGPVTQEGVCIIKQGDLHCLDPISGDLRWVQRGVGNYKLLGDDRYVIVVRPSGDMRIFEIRDGMEVRSIPADREKSDREGEGSTGEGSTVLADDLADDVVDEGFQGPLASVHWTTVGRNILYHDGSYNRGTDLEVRLWDTIEQRDKWVWPVAAKSKGWIVDGKELALFQQDGKFVILNLEDGRVIIETQLLPEAQLEPFVYVSKSSDQYLVVTNRNDQRRMSKLGRGQITVQVPKVGWQPATPRITGHMYALDRKTGEHLWEKPVSVEQFGILLPLAAEIPVVAFVRHVRIRRPRPNKKKAYVSFTRTAVAVVDRRTGKEVFQRDDLPINVSSFCSLNADLETNRLTLFLPNETEFVMDLTDDPNDDAPHAKLKPVEIEVTAREKKE